MMWDDDEYVNIPSIWDKIFYYTFFRSYIRNGYRVYIQDLSGVIFLKWYFDLY